MTLDERRPSDGDRCKRCERHPPLKLGGTLCKACAVDVSKEENAWPDRDISRRGSDQVGRPVLAHDTSPKTPGPNE